VNDEEFIRERVKSLREIAEDADPFIKKRLLDLINGYERRLGSAPRAPTRLPNVDVG